MIGTEKTETSWQEVDAAWYRSTYPLAETLLADIRADDPAAVYCGIGPVFLHSPNPYFDERWYRARYPAVRQAIRAGHVESGFAHYQRLGRGELSPHWLFDPAIYRRSFQDRYGHGLPAEADADPYDHFLATGQHQGLSGHFLFDAAIYTATAPYDLARCIEREGPFTTCLLQIHAGDDPTTSALFDAGWYRARYPAATADITGKAWLCALHHYLTNDDPPAFDPGPRFCEMSYRAWHVDVADAVRRGEYRNGFEHYMRVGRQEHRLFSPKQVPSSGPVVARFPLRTKVFDNLVLGPDDGAQPQAGERKPSKEPAAETPFRAGTFVYGGTLFGDLSRCLTDSLSRLWFLRERPELPVLWHTADARIAEGGWPNELAQLWNLLGLDRHPGLFVTEPTRFERVIIPESGLMDDCAIHHRQARALGVHAAAAQPGQSRIWMSSFDPHSKNDWIEAENQVATILAARGWTIVTPATMPLPRRLDLFTEAAVLAGISAAVFFPILLVEAPTAALIPVLGLGTPVPLLQAVAQARQVLPTFVVPKRRTATGAMDLADPAGLADTICEAADAAVYEQQLSGLER